MTILALTALALTAHADVSNFDIVKTQDGKTVQCESASDLGRAGYRPLITTMQADGEALKLDTAIATLVCAQDGGKFAFASRLPNDGIASRDLDGNPQTELLGQQKYLVVDRNSQVLGSIDTQNVFLQPLSYRFPAASSFSREDLARLARGETVHARWELFLQGTHSIRRASGELIPLGLFTGGAYALSFDVRETNGRLEVANFILR